MKRVLPPTYFLLALIAMAFFHFLWPIRRFWEFPLRLVGLVPLAFGIALNVAADRQFRRQQTTMVPFQESSALVTAFPFSASRNPMYLGIAMMLLGVALLFGTLSPLIPVGVFSILMDLRFIRAEERMLAASFGREWEQYRTQVRRWF